MNEETSTLDLEIADTINTILNTHMAIGGGGDVAKLLRAAGYAKNELGGRIGDYYLPRLVRVKYEDMREMNIDIEALKSEIKRYTLFNANTLKDYNEEFLTALNEDLSYTKGDIRYLIIESLKAIAFPSLNKFAFTDDEVLECHTIQETTHVYCTKARAKAFEEGKDATHHNGTDARYEGNIIFNNTSYRIYL